MFLSRVELNPARRETARALSSPQILHATIENCFPIKRADDKRTLWRVDALGGHWYLLLMSREKPDFTRFIEQFGERSKLGETRDYGAFIARLATGQKWHFRLAANPTHTVKTDKEKRGKVYAHVTVEQQKQWLLTRAAKHGFSLDETAFDVVARNHREFRRQEKYVTLNVAVFEGILAIADLNLFTDTLTRGIGRGKAYGCGLLTLAKIL